MINKIEGKTKSTKALEVNNVSLFVYREIHQNKFCSGRLPVKSTLLHPEADSGPLSFQSVKSFNLRRVSLGEKELNCKPFFGSGLVN